MAKITYTSEYIAKREDVRKGGLNQGCKIGVCGWCQEGLAPLRFHKGTNLLKSELNRRMPNCTTVVQTANDLCEPEIRLNSLKK